MIVKFLRHHGLHNPGEVAGVTPSIAAALVRAGVAVAQGSEPFELVEDEVPAPVEVEPVVTSADDGAPPAQGKASG